MDIILTNVGKRFNREWIFRHCSYSFTSGKKYAITGHNGSGKSTLLQIIAGSLTFNEGTIDYQSATASIVPEKVYQSVSIVAPYLELVEEMTANEFLDFHASFKKPDLPAAEILAKVELSHAADKQIRYYSSGMKQRLKMAQAFFFQSELLCLDEPTTNLDADGIAIYQQLVANYSNNRLVIISSNDINEYGFCDDVIRIGDFKQ